MPETYVKKLKPKCINHKDYMKAQCLGHSAQGFLTPCCWIDAWPKLRGDADDIFYQEKFKISNVKDVKKDILESKEWVEFYMMLQQKPNKAPPVCFKFCGEGANMIDQYGDDVYE